MPQLDLVLGSAPVSLVEGFEIAFANDAGEQRLPLCDVGDVALESCLPVRRFPSYKGQRHYSGQWWTATTGGLVGFESWLERDTLIGLDFDAGVVGVASQPFWMFWTAENGKPRSHAPDYFARLADGSARVIDCRPAQRIKPRDQAAFDATRTACDLMGWHYEVVDTPTEPVRTNLRWLAGYRHPRHHLPAVASALQAVFTAPRGLEAGAQAVGDPIAVLPVLFHLLWRHDLHADLTRMLAAETLVTAAAATPGSATTAVSQ